MFQNLKKLRDKNLTLKYRPINADHAKMQNGRGTEHDVQTEPDIADENSCKVLGEENLKIKFVWVFLIFF